MVNGELLMEGRRVLMMEEEKVLEQAQRASEALLAKLEGER
jgi:hypothetical protein